MVQPHSLEFISHLDAFEKVHLGLVAQTCNPSLLKDEAGGLQVKPSLDNLRRPCFKIKSAKGPGYSSVVEPLGSKQMA